MLLYKVVVVDSDCKYPTALLHILLQFPRKVQMFGAGHLNQRLQEISISVRCSSVMSLMPVDFRADNLLALAVLASFDDKSSSKRDQTWQFMCKGVNTKPCEFLGAASLPVPGPARPTVPMVSPLPYQQDDAPRGRTPARVERSRSRTPAPRPRSTPRAAPEDVFPLAVDRLLESVGDLWRSPYMQEFAPGTLAFKDQFRNLELFMPEWIFKVLEYDAKPLYTDKRGTAPTIFGTSVIRCLKVFAKAIKVCALALFRASKAVVFLLRDALDPLPQLLEHLHEASEACKGILPVVQAFRHMKPVPWVDNIGAKPDTDERIMPLQTMPMVFQGMSDDNRVKNMYRFMWLASARLEEAYPDDDVYISWDRIARNVGELQQYLFLAHGECESLVKYCRLA